MQIHFSRHARRRAKLYNIPLSEITEAISEVALDDGRQEILKMIPGMKYPLKVIVSREDDQITVITNYPFKKSLIP